MPNRNDPPPAVGHAGPVGYADGAEHLADELARIHALLQAYTLRWERAALGAGRHDPEFVRAELHRFRSSRFQWIDQELNAEFETAVRHCVEEARLHELRIVRRLAATSRKVFLPLRTLQHAFGLTTHQPGAAVRDSTLYQDVILLALLAHRSPPHRRLVALLQEEGHDRGWPTVDPTLRVLEPTRPSDRLSWNAFDPTSPLMAQGLVTLAEAVAGDPLPRRLVRLDDRIAAFLLGDAGLDPRLTGVVRRAGARREWDELYLPPDDAARLQRLSEWWWDKRPRDTGLVLLLHGPPGAPRLQAAQAFLTWKGAAYAFLIVDALTALRRPDDWEAFVGWCYREARLQRVAVYWQRAEALLAADQPAHRWETVIAHAERYDHLTFLESTVGWEPADHFHDPRRTFVRIDFPPPDRVLRRRLWADRLSRPGLPAPDDAELDLLANSFQFTEGQIDDALAVARGLDLYRDGGDPRGWWERLYEACRRQSARRLVAFAQRIEPRPGTHLSDLILPESNRRQMHELSARIAHRDYVYRELGFEQRLTLGRGLVVLFTGASGTGKTMAAALLAADQRVDLYKVDLAAIVSKYVGETEKNLGRLFAEAQDANAILFFDEADAVFGKRGEVEDARDRWANLEVNYLLQRVEEYTGTVILATNLRQNIDEAFLRRIQVVVDFPVPDAAHRLLIFRGMFPPDVGRPTDAELKELADRFPLTGGSIKNVVLEAAFRAAACLRPHGEPLRITQQQLAAAAAREYQKLGKPVTPSDFGPKFFASVREDLAFGPEAKAQRTAAETR